MKLEHKHAALLKDPKLPKPSYAPIRAQLGELMPHLMPGGRGRARLTLALTQRFGENFRMNAQAQAMVQHFDAEDAKLRSWFRSKGVSHG